MNVIWGPISANVTGQMRWNIPSPLPLLGGTSCSIAISEIVTKLQFFQRCQLLLPIVRDGRNGFEFFNDFDCAVAAIVFRQKSEQIFWQIRPIIKCIKIQIKFLSFLPQSLLTIPFQSWGQDCLLVEMMNLGRTLVSSFVRA